jgi:hypothetical protein
MKMLTQIERLAERTKGFLEAEEGRRLYRLAREASRLGPCLEIGSYCGKSTLYMASGCKENDGILFSIDHHRGSEEQQPGEPYFDPDLFNPQTKEVDTFGHFRKTLRMGHLEEYVVPVVCTSFLAARAWSTPLGMVFIDGGHSLDMVRQDFQIWSQHVLPRGYLVFHDIYPDPADGGQAPYLVYQEALASGFFKIHPMTLSLGVLERNQCR